MVRLKLRSTTYLGVGVGSSRIKAVELVRGENGGLTVRALEAGPTPAGIVHYPLAAGDRLCQRPGRRRA